MPRARTGHQENHAGGPATPGTPAGPQPPDLEPPRDPPPPTGAPLPETARGPRREDRLSSRPATRSGPAGLRGLRPGGSAPPNTYTTPRTGRPPESPDARAATRRLRPGAGAGGDLPGSATRPGLHGTPRARGGRAAHAPPPHTASPATDAGPARRDPPPPRWGEARAAVGRASLRSGPTAKGPVPTRGRWPLVAATTRRGGAAAGGSGTPRHPLGSLEKAVSPRAHRPPEARRPQPPFRGGPRQGDEGGEAGSAVRGRHGASQRAFAVGAGRQAGMRDPCCLQARPRRREARPGVAPTGTHTPGRRKRRRAPLESAGDRRRRLGPPRSLTRLPRAPPSEGDGRRAPKPLASPAATRGGATHSPAAPPPKGGRGDRGRACLPLPGSTPSPHAPQGCTRPRRRPEEGGGGGRWERGTTPPARLRAPERRPGALQGHHREPGDARAGAARRGGTHPRRGVGAARGTQPGGEAECPLRRETPSPPTPRERQRDEVGPGPAPLLLHTTPAGGEERRGAPRAEREERSHPPGMSVPRLARLRPGPGERDVTTSIDPHGGKSLWLTSRAGKRGQANETVEGPLLPVHGAGDGETRWGARGSRVGRAVAHRTQARLGQGSTRGPEGPGGTFSPATLGC